MIQNFSLMSKDTRSTALEAAFAEPAGETTKVGSLHLRPLSLGTVNVCRQLGLSLFLDEDVEIDDTERQRQIVAFAWVQSAPLSVVLAALRNDTAIDCIAEFEFQLEVGDLPALIAEIQRVSKLAAAAVVDVAPKPGHTGEDGAPPNY